MSKDSENWNHPTRTGRYHEFSPEEIAREKERFANTGGLVHRLPEQKVPVNKMVTPREFKNYSGLEMVGYVDGD